MINKKYRPPVFFIGGLNIFAKKEDQNHLDLEEYMGNLYLMKNRV